jgi:hypothetical protein
LVIWQRNDTICLNQKIRCMKLQLMSLVIAAGVLFASCTTTQQSTSDNAALAVPKGIQSTFSMQYPDASAVTWSRFDATTVPIDWEMTGWQALDADDYAVTFTMGRDTYHAWYDANGAWIGSTYGISDLSRVPPSILSMIKQKYPDYTVEKVDRETWKDQIAYEVKLKKADDSKVKLLVSGDGMILKEKLKD